MDHQQMKSLLLVGVLSVLISLAKSQIMPQVQCSPQSNVCSPGSLGHGCPGGAMAFCNSLGQCCVQAVIDDNTENCPEESNPVPNCRICTDGGGECTPVGTTFCCGAGPNVRTPPLTPATPLPTKCLSQPVCKSNAQCAGLTGGNYECSSQGQCCVKPIDSSGTTIKPELVVCSNVDQILYTAVASETCMGILERTMGVESSIEDLCSALVEGLDCVALAMVGEKLKAECVDVMFAYMQQNPSAIFVKIKTLLAQFGLGNAVQFNQELVQNAFKCREIAKGDNKDGTMGDDSDTPDTAEWNTTCPAIRVVGRANRCPPGSCSTDDSCGQNTVCCEGPNSCNVCLPDLRRCTDPDAVLTGATTCLVSFAALINDTINFDTYCSIMWKGVKCLADRLMEGSDYSKLCVERMAHFLQQSADEILGRIKDEAAKYMLSLRALEKYGMNTTKCKENPLYEPEKRPVSEEVNVCTNATTILTSFQQCLGSKSLSMTQVSNAACSYFKQTVYCVARKLLKQATDDLQTSKCVDAVQQIMAENEARFVALMGTFDLEKCEERITVCGGDVQPSDEFFCRQGSCPTGYDCKSGYCCPSETPGLCPKPRGIPVCKQKCTNDTACGDGDKCCDVGCGYKTCIPLETHDKSRCEMEFENGRKQLENAGICGDGKTILNIPRCQNTRYFPIQGDIQHGRMYCVNEEGDKIPGSDFVGNNDCTTVRPGVCPVKPSACMGDSPLMVEQCKNDKDCTEVQKCCHTVTENVCVKKCQTAVQAPSVLADDCPNRQCCPITLCQDKVCPRYKSAVCRINSCGGCSVEFYNVRGEKVDCETNVTLCEKKRVMALHINAQRSKTDDQRLASFVNANEKMGNIEEDMTEDDIMADAGDMMDEDDNEARRTDEYGELRERIDRLPNDTAQDEEMEGMNRDSMMHYKLENFCLTFMRYNICQNNGSCVLGRGESFWEMCQCPAGYHGLFCEIKGQLITNTSCYRDAERINTMLRILKQADGVKEKLILHEVFGVLKPQNGLIPNLTCDFVNYLPIQQAMTFPKTSDSLNLLYCAHKNNGSRILGTPVALQMSKSLLNCSVTGLVPDPLRLPRRCLSAKQAECLSGSCQYFWNQVVGICEEGQSGNGFNALTECYDQCSATLQCDPMAGNRSASCYMVTLGPQPCRITIGGTQTDQCDYNTQFCKITVVDGRQEGLCKDFPAQCLLTPDKGYGDKEVGAYYFNAVRRRCEKFEYKGYGGNANRFYSLHQCHTECSTRSYKYQDVVCPIPKPLVLQDSFLTDMCDDDYSCPDMEVCCSNGVARVCTSPIVTCFTGERCSLEGACVDGRCTCRECTNVTSSPICGSNGKTYNNMCMLQRDACLTMQPLKKVYDGPCNAECGSVKCKPNQICDNNTCTCDIVCIDLYAPVCGRGQTSGVLRTFGNDCVMRRQGCTLGEIFVKVHDGSCAADCLLPCTKEYRPVCAFDTSSVVPKLTTYPNACEMKRTALCNGTKLEILYGGPCNRECGSYQCQLHEVCENNVCKCPSMCTLEYMPVCAYPQGNPASLSTFSNGCQMRSKGCQEKKLYVIHSMGPCEKPEPELVCPDNNPNIPLSAEIGCDKNTNAFCNKTTEVCCPYGAGTRCIPRKALIRSVKTKDGVCPVLSSLNFDKSQCVTLMSKDDSDCAGQAKSCWNMVCGYNTCTEPLVRPDMNKCPANHTMIPELSCDSSQNLTGCPRNAICQRVNGSGQEDAGVCCMPKTQTPATEDDILGSRLCQLMGMLGVTCRNNGTCIGNLKNGTICACKAGSYGPFCGSVTPPATCSQQVQCFADPCMTAKCPGVPDAVCNSNYCGGCNSLFKNNTMDVSHLCHASPCLRKKALIKALNDSVGSVWKNNFTDGLMRHLMYVMKKMGIRGIPLNGELNCSSGGLYDLVQCSFFPERNATYCYCVNPRTGEAIPNGPSSTSIQSISCSAFNQDNVGLQDFCLRLPIRTRVCSATQSVRYFYNPATMDCEAFTETGCNEDLKNNFNSYETCKSACGVQSTVLSICARVRCGNNQHCRVRDGTAECVDAEEVGMFEPLCDAQGMFESKQCQGEVCRCVNPETGAEIPNSVASGEALECRKDGQTVRPVRAEEKKCQGGTSVRPQFCEDGGDPCNNCQKKVQQNNVQPQKQQTDVNGVCTTCESCPASQGRKDCGQNDPCEKAVCKNDATAICRVDRCTCKAEFVSGDRIVDCSKAQSQCLKEKSYIEAEERSRMLNNNGRVPTDVVQLRCSSTGGYDAKCEGSLCHCLNATSGEKIGDPVATSNINTVNCAQTQRQTKAKRVKVTMKVTEKPLEQLSSRQIEQIKSKLKEEFEKRVPVVVKNITLYSGSTMADMDVENCVTACQTEAQTSDLPSLVGTVVSEIDSGEIQISAEGETFVPSAAALTGITTVAELEGPSTEKPEPDDNKTKIIIIVVVVVGGSAMIVAIGIAIYCYKKANKQKTKDIPFSDLQGKDNPVYLN